MADAFMTEYEVGERSKDQIWSISMLASVFGFNRQNMSKKMDGVPRNGEINGSAAIFLRDAAEKIYAQEYYADLDDMKPTDRKAYYESELKRVELMDTLGEYTKTEDTHNLVSDVFKRMDLAISIACDEIEREEGLSPAQFESLERQLDKLRVVLAGAISE